MVRKAVVMAGGLATRLRPLTTSINKHMLPVYDRPMIQRVIEHLVSSGITDMLVLLNNAFAQPVMELLEHGDRLGCSITYAYERHVTDVSSHLRYARSYVGDEPFMLMLGDSFYTEPLQTADIRYPHMWVAPLDPAFDDFRKYAEVRLSTDRKRVVDIVEKPVEQKTGLIQTGAWVFGPEMFDLAEQCKRTEGKEVQVRTLVHHYLKQGTMWATVLPPRSFLDLGTPDALLLAGTIAKEEHRARAQT